MSRRAHLMLTAERIEINREPILSCDEYHIIHYFKSQGNKISFLYSEIRTSYLDYKEIKKMYEEKLNSIKLRTDAEDYLKDDKFNEQMLKMATSLNAYLRNKPLPFFRKKKIGLWTKEEEEFIKTIMETIGGKPNYPLLAICFPGRSGFKVYNHYCNMISEKDIDSFDLGSNRKYNFNFDPQIRRYFLRKSECILAKEIRLLYKKGVQITEKKI